MSKKSILLASALVLLIGFSLYVNRDRFRSESIQIGHRTMDARNRQTKNAPASVLTFLLDRQLKLTSVKVVLASAFETNKYSRPIWELISDSNSVPTKTFIYGAGIRGMRPSVKGATANPLEPGVKYRLFIEAGGERAEHEFTWTPHTP